MIDRTTANMPGTLMYQPIATPARRRVRHSPARCVAALAMVAVLTLPSPATGQERVVREQLNGWINLRSDVQLSRRWFVEPELVLRMHGPVNKMAQAFPRVGVRFQPLTALMLNWGYAYVETWPYGKLPVALQFPEHRMWQQVQLSHAVGRVAISHRYRLEQRWLGRMALERGESRVQNWVRSNRMRYRLQAVVPLQGATLDDGEFYANVSEEPFLNWGANIRGNVFDQNRLGATLGRRVSKALRIEVGYLEQLLQKPDGRTLERNHTLVLNILSNFSLAGDSPTGSSAGAPRR